MNNIIKGWITLMPLLLLGVQPLRAQDSLPPLCPQGVASPAPDAKKVLTTFTVIADIASNVSCNLSDVQSLTRPGAEIHHYEPTPSDLTRAQDADLVIFNGLNLELWFKQFMGAVSDVPSINLSDGLTPVLIADGAYKDLPNPHAWMSPRSALIYVENIRKGLTMIDPANADAYTANANAYIAHLEDIDRLLQESLAELPDNQRTLASCEGAFSYLARDYNMNELYLWAVNADQQGTPKQVAHLIDSIKANEIPAIFCESTVNNTPAQVVADDTGAKFGGTLYVDSLSEADGPVPTYLDLLKYDATTIINGLLGK